MRFEHVTSCSHPPELLFRAYRDHLVEIAPMIRSVSRVELRSRSDNADGTVQLVHQWHGSNDAVPVFLRSFVRDEMLQWLDRTDWDATRREARWTIEIPGLGNAVKAWGSWRFTAHARGGQVDAIGDFEVNPAALPPAFASAKPMIERFVVGLLVPMVEDAGSAVVRWLDTRP